MANVTMPNGDVVAFPDDMPKTEIRALIEKKFPDAARQALHDTGKKPYQTAMEGLGTLVGNLPASIAESKTNLSQMAAEAVTDFIDVRDFLVREGYAAPDRVAAHGGSAGGLLMGAVVNIRPDLFKAVICKVPFVDVVTTMNDPSIPLTTLEYDQWGNPDEKEYYEYMLSYSPYDQVKKQDYPNMYVSTGLHDSQVQYFEPAKWVAKLRVMKTNDNQLFLDTNMDAGHGGASGRFEALKELAKEFTFLLDLEKIKK